MINIDHLIISLEVHNLIFSMHNLHFFGVAWHQLLNPQLSSRAFRHFFLHYILLKKIQALYLFLCRICIKAIPALFHQILILQ